jgi:hypothetical protein
MGELVRVTVELEDLVYEDRAIIDYNKDILYNILMGQIALWMNAIGLEDDGLSLRIDIEDQWDEE